MPTSAPLLFAVMGQSISHSLSPTIHSHFAKQFDIDLIYKKIEVSKGKFKSAVQQFRDEKGYGLNITSPFKKEAYTLCLSRSEAVNGKAINTIYWKDNLCCGINTDGPGLVQDLVYHLKWSLENKSILILGNGGAANGVLTSLLSLKPKSIVLAYRNQSDKSNLFVDPKIKFIPYNQLQGPYDFIFNSTGQRLSHLPFVKRWVPLARCYDFNYNVNAMQFLTEAKQAGAQCGVNGLGMLIEQAALSFKQWHNLMPDTKTLHHLLKKDAFRI
jgi:shikimate dehydrogenase